MDHLADLFGGMGIDAGEGFVQHGEAGLAGQRDGDLAAAALAARQIAHLLAAHVFQPEFLDQFVHLRLAGGRVGQPRFQHQP